MCLACLKCTWREGVASPDQRPPLLLEDARDHVGRRGEAARPGVGRGGRGRGSVVVRVVTCWWCSLLVCVNIIEYGDVFFKIGVSSDSFREMHERIMNSREYSY